MRRIEHRNRKHLPHLFREYARPEGYTVSGPNLELVYGSIALACAAVGAVCDARTRRIPNWLTGPSIFLGLVLHFVLGSWYAGFAGGWRALGVAALGGIIGGAVFLLFYLAGGMGAGDVKLITAVCTLAGLGRVTEILILTALMGGILAVAVALYHRRLKETLTNITVLAVHHGSSGLQPHSDLNVGNSKNLRLPYGIAIAAGTALSFCNVLLS